MKYLYAYLIFSFFCFAIVMYGMRRKCDIEVGDIGLMLLVAILPGFNLFTASLWVWDMTGIEINTKSIWKHKVLKKKK